MIAEIPNVQPIIDELSKTIFVIDKVMCDKKSYKELKKKILDFLRAGFEVKELREANTYYKFNEDDDVHVMQLRHFLTNIIFWSPFISLNSIEDIDESYIVDTSQLSAKYIENYLNEKIINPYRYDISNRKLNKAIHDVIYALSQISEEFNPIFGLGFNIETFIDVANRNPRFDEIIHTKVDENALPNEIENELDRLMKEEVEILKIEDTVLRPILITDGGIKHKQLAEMTINVGLKPDLSGNTIPIPINTNLLTGLNKIPNYYIDAISGRKALIANKMVMGRSGFFAKKAMLSVSEINLNKEEDNCGTVNPIMYEIKTPIHLKRLIGRVYRTPSSRRYSIIRGDETQLIGKKIYVKSPITCACSNNTICRDCYGPLLYHTNKDICVGGYAGAIITNPVSQSILSTKHLNTTVSESITFNENFNKFFTLTSNEININSELKDQENYSLLLIKKNIVSIPELDEAEFNTFVVMIHVKNNKTGEIYEVYENTNKELFLTPELWDTIKSIKKHNKEYYEVPFIDVSDDTRLFLLAIENNELTRPLYNIMGLLDSKKKTSELGITSINGMAQTLLDLLIESNINVQAVHGEIMIKPLIRSKSDILSVPNFREYGAMDEADILTISAALEKNPSPTIGLASSYLRRQLKSPLTFKKDQSSFIDPFFKTRL